MRANINFWTKSTDGLIGVPRKELVKRRM